MRARIYVGICAVILLAGCSGKFDKELAQLKAEVADSQASVNKAKAELVEMQKNPSWPSIVPLVASSRLIGNIGVAQKTLDGAPGALEKLEKNQRSDSEAEWRSDAGELERSLKHASDLANGSVARVKLLLKNVGQERDLAKGAILVADRVASKSAVAAAVAESEIKANPAAASVFTPIAARLRKIATDARAVSVAASKLPPLDQTLDLCFQTSTLKESLEREKARLASSHTSISLPYRKTVAALSAEYKIKLGRESWNDTEDGSRVYSYPVDGISREGFRAAAALTGDAVIAKRKPGGWEMTEPVVFHGMQSSFDSNELMPYSDTDAVIYVEDLTETYKVRYREERGDDIKVSGWEEIPEDLYKKLSSLDGKPVVEKQAGYPMSAAHVNY